MITSLTQRLRRQLSPLTLALSAALGVAAGILPAGTLIWSLVVVLFLVLRTHLVVGALAFLCTWLISLTLNGVCIEIGQAVLQHNEQQWRHVLSLPVVCCLDLNRASVMGDTVLALCTSLGIFIFALVAGSVLKRHRNATNY